MMGSNGRVTVAIEEFRLFHRIDRVLYSILVKDLGRSQIESLYTIGLWLWLERRGFYNLVNKIVRLPTLLVNELADEASICLKCVNPMLPFVSESSEIPLTHSLVNKAISLEYFLESQSVAASQIQSLVTSVCVPALSDVNVMGEMGCIKMMPLPVPGEQGADIIPLRMSGEGESSSWSTHSQGSRGACEWEETISSKNERTMFVTFSKGYPVSETEVRSFFSRLLGNCIESFHMQEVTGPDEQALYAKIVFIRPAFITAILNGGAKKVKFTINGKHVWMRRFVTRNANAAPTSTCTSSIST